MKFLLAALVGFTLTSNAASSFSGYKQTEKEAYYAFDDTIHRLADSPEAFYIMFANRAAFYTFPKDNSAKMVSEFLEKCRARRTVIHIEINPYTAEIYRLSAK